MTNSSKPVELISPETLALGERMRRATLGDAHVDRSLKKAKEDTFLQPLQETVMGLAWGAVWGRPGLDVKSRSLVTVSILIALGRTTELAVHINGALNNGWTKEELQEILIHSSAYCGWPAALEASRVAKEVLDQRDA